MVSVDEDLWALDLKAPTKVALLVGQGLVCLGLPALVLARLPAPEEPSDAAPAVAGGGSPRIGALVVATTRARRVLLPALAALTLVAGWAGLQSRAAFDVRDFFSSETDFVTGLDKYDRHAVPRAGEPADIYVEADLSNPDVLAVLRDTRETLRSLATERLSQDGQGRTKTGGGVVELLEVAGGRLDAGADALESLIRRVQEEGVPGEGEGPELLSATKARSMVSLGEQGLADAATRLHLELRNSRDEDEVEATRAFLAPLVRDLQEALQTHDPDARAILTGGAIVRVASLEAVLLAFQLSFPFALLFCLLAASVFMRSLRYGAISTVPVVLVAIWLYGFMYAVGYSLNVVTATIGAISIGVGIDFSVHFTMRFREEMEEAASRIDALRGAGAGTGQALAASAFSSALGFSILAFAPMPMFAAYGLLTAVMIMLALAAALLVLPSLLLLVTPEVAD